MDEEKYIEKCIDLEDCSQLYYKLIDVFEILDNPTPGVHKIGNVYNG